MLMRCVDFFGEYFIQWKEIFFEHLGFKHCTKNVHKQIVILESKKTLAIHLYVDSYFNADCLLWTSVQISAVPLSEKYWLRPCCHCHHWLQLGEWNSWFSFCWNQWGLTCFCFKTISDFLQLTFSHQISEKYAYQYLINLRCKLFMEIVSASYIHRYKLSV